MLFSVGDFTLTQKQHRKNKVLHMKMVITDMDETLLKPGDTAIVKGVNHAWSNKDASAPLSD